MIIGNGDIASALKEAMRPKEEDFVFFASGVSNSQEKRQSEFDREVELLAKQDFDKHLVYISSLCVFYSDTRYAEHKRVMEKAVKKFFDRYTIVRLGTITWGDNPHTLINFIRGKIEKNEPFEVKDVYRYVVDKDEFLHWIDKIPTWNCEFNITGQFLKVSQIVRKYGYVGLHPHKD